MTDVLKNMALIVMSEKCFDNYFVDYNFLDVPCFKSLLSKCLGLGIIAGSMLVKVPQLMKIVKNKSGEGINIVGVLLDLIAITFHMSYSFVNGYPFSSWGDNTFLAFQTAAIAALVLFFGGSKGKCLTFCMTYAVLLYILNSGVTSLKILTMMQSFNIPILLTGKMSQALTNYKNSSTGQLSAATCFLLFAGSLARIFTSIQETGDKMMVMTFCASSAANGMILSQLLYYWNNPSKGIPAPAPLPKKMKSQKED